MAINKKKITFLRICSIKYYTLKAWMFTILRIWNWREEIILTQLMSQGAEGEFNKIVLDKKKTVPAWMFNTYRFRNHFVSNPLNSELIRLKKRFKNNFLLKLNVEKVRTNEKSLWCGTESFQLTAASQLIKQ